MVAHFYITLSNFKYSENANQVSLVNLKSTDTEFFKQLGFDTINNKTTPQNKQL